MMVDEEMRLQGGDVEVDCVGKLCTPRKDDQESHVGSA